MATHLRNCNKRFGRDTSVESQGSRNHQPIGGTGNSIGGGQGTPSRRIQSKMMSKGKLDALNGRNASLNSK